MADMTQKKILKTTDPVRLDLLLVGEWPHLTSRLINRMVSEQQVMINDLPARKIAQEVIAGDEVVVRLPLPEPIIKNIPALDLPVLYEDENMIVVDKPAHMAVKRSKRKAEVSVASSLAEMRPGLSNVGGVGRCGLVTPLEDEVSGLVLAAKDEHSYRECRRHVTRQRVTYTYTAMVEGRIRGEGRIDEPIGNARHERERLQVAREGRRAVTVYRAQRQFVADGQAYTLLLVQPETSRRHQIRVHVAWYGFPIVGDSLYGSRQQPLLSDRLFLHLSVIEFPHPLNSELIHVESVLPPALQAVITYLTRPKY